MCYHFLANKLENELHRALLAALAVLAAFSSGTAAQTYPQRQIQFVVPTSAGGGTDTMARVMAQKLTEAWGQNVIVDNRPGASGAIGVGLVAKAPPDGHTLLIASAGHVVFTPSLVKVTFDPLRDFAPVTMLTSGPLIVVVHPTVPANSIPQLIALAKAQPGKLNYGSSGTGTSTHIGAELFKSVTQTDLVHIPFKGQAPATTALLGGQIDLSFNTPPPTLPHVRAGRIRALAVTSLKRSSIAPELPTVAESGVPDFEVSVWYGMLAPAGTPPEVVTRLNQEIVRIIRLPEVQQRFAHDGVEPVGNTPVQFAAYFKSELAKWASVILRAKIRADG